MPVKAQPLGPGTFSLGAALTALDLTAQVTKLTVQWSVNVEDAVETLSGEELEGEPDYNAELSFTVIQDLTEAGMFDYTWANKGSVVPFTFTPNTAAGRTVTGMVRVDPLNLGGDVKKKNTTEATWKCVGQPVLADEL